VLARFDQIAHVEDRLHLFGLRLGTVARRLDDDLRALVVVARLIARFQPGDDDRHDQRLIEPRQSAGRGGEMEVAPRRQRKADGEDLKSEVVLEEIEHAGPG
jgi:hypothetical protein